MYNNNAAFPAISSIAEHLIISNITGLIPFRGCIMAGHVVSPLQSIPHTQTTLAVPIRASSTIPGANNSRLHLHLTYKGWNSARNCKPSSTRMRWIQLWKCSHIWWMLRNWRQKSSTWRFREEYSDDLSSLVRFIMTLLLTSFICWAL